MNWQHRRVLRAESILDRGREVKIEFSKIKKLKEIQYGESRKYRVQQWEEQLTVWPRTTDQERPDKLYAKNKEKPLSSLKKENDVIESLF